MADSGQTRIETKLSKQRHIPDILPASTEIAGSARRGQTGENASQHVRPLCAAAIQRLRSHTQYVSKRMIGDKTADWLLCPTWVSCCDCQEADWDPSLQQTHRYNLQGHFDLLQAFAPTRSRTRLQEPLNPGRDCCIHFRDEASSDPIATAARWSAGGCRARTGECPCSLLSVSASLRTLLITYRGHGRDPPARCCCASAAGAAQLTCGSGGGGCTSSGSGSSWPGFARATNALAACAAR